MNNKNAVMVGVAWKKTDKKNQTIFGCEVNKPIEASSTIMLFPFKEHKKVDKNKIYPDYELWKILKDNNEQISKRDPGDIDGDTGDIE